MSKLQRAALMSLFLVTSVGCDQATKHLATQSLKSTAGHSFFGDVLRLQYAENPGAFLSLGGTLSPTLRFWFLTVLVGVMLAGIITYAFMSGKLTRLQISAIALIAGGGLSNWIDRVGSDGRVVDFLNLGIGPVRTGIFNVADIAIVAGGVILAVTGSRKPRPLPPALS